MIPKMTEAERLEALAREMYRVEFPFTWSRLKAGSAPGFATVIEQARAALEHLGFPGVPEPGAARKAISTLRRAQAHSSQTTIAELISEALAALGAASENPE
jgi:hypothetical protein